MEGLPTNRTESGQRIQDKLVIGNSRCYHDLASFACGYTPPQFVEKIFEKDDVVLRLLLFGPIHRNKRRDPVPVRREIEVAAPADPTGPCDSPCGPHAWLLRGERIAFHGIGRHHDPVVLCTEEQLAPIARPRGIPAAVIRNLPLSALPEGCRRKRPYVHL